VTSVTWLCFANIIIIIMGISLNVSIMIFYLLCGSFDIYFKFRHVFYLLLSLAGA